MAKQPSEILERMKDAFESLKERLLPFFAKLLGQLKTINFSNIGVKLNSFLTGSQKHLDSDLEAGEAEYLSDGESDGPTQISVRSSTHSDPVPAVPQVLAEPGFQQAKLAPLGSPPDSSVSSDPDSVHENDQAVAPASEPTAFIDRSALNEAQPVSQINPDINPDINNEELRDNSSTAILTLPHKEIESTVMVDREQIYEDIELNTEEADAAQRPEYTEPSSQHEPQEQGDTGSRKIKMCTLFASIWSYDGVLVGMNPSALTHALKEFQADGASVAAMFQGTYEKNSAISYSIHWEVIGEAEDNQEAIVAQLGMAVRSALTLRQNLMQWNLGRSQKGLSPLVAVLGADFGEGFLCEIVQEEMQTIQNVYLGDPAQRARALSQLSMSLGTDLLISESLWSYVSKQFIGERLAQAQLTAQGVRTAVFKVQGYWNEQGQKIFVSGIESSMQDIPAIARQIDAPKIEVTSQDRTWTVNNGNQIIGPILPKDIAKLLYTQDLDFDCECWSADGNRVTIAKSGMFGVAEDPEARFWIFDGETIHGPLTEGFVRTGVSRKIFKKEASVCESNTLSGWKLIKVWLTPVQAAVNIAVSALLKETVNVHDLPTPPEYAVPPLDPPEPSIVLADVELAESQTVSKTDPNADPKADHKAEMNEFAFAGFADVAPPTFEFARDESPQEAPQEKKDIEDVESKTIDVDGVDDAA